MIWNNIEIYNAAEIVPLDDGITWKRLPEDVTSALELDKDGNVASNVTGVELRFVIKGEEARITMASLDSPDGCILSTFHVYYGAVQGGWQDHEVHKLIGNEPSEFVFKKPELPDLLRRMSAEAGYDFDPDVVRVIFDRGHIKITDVSGAVEPPHRSQTPKRVMLSYGSSITHGSNAIDASHAWTAVVAHRLGMDCRNLGMAGSCAMEKPVIDYIASEGKKGNWDVATLELGINVLKWEKEKIYERVTYAVDTIARANPDKPILVISPFYCRDDFVGEGNANRWREMISEVVGSLHHKNVLYKNGLDFIGDMSGISADFVHPNIHGVAQIAREIEKTIRFLLSQEH